MPRDRLPSLFIVGAPKCGTTSMASWLNAHPNVFMSKPKEPNFFCTDLPGTRGFDELTSYLRIFEDASDEHLVLGEASTWYLYSETAIPGILELNPAARVLVMIRNPVEMAQSLHGQLLFNGIETETDFAHAWTLQPQRADRRFLQYAKVCALGQQLSRAIAVVPSEQLKVIVFDDLRARPKQIYDEVVSWLRLPPFEAVDFSVRNPAKRTRSATVSRFARRTPGALLELNKRLKRLAGVESWGLMDRVTRLNVANVQRKPLDRATLGELREQFGPDVTMLSKLVGRDLSGWLRDGDH
jgi:hypothetical protein